ncbi:MAG: heme biosynthesis protein HemY [Alphaproteobacteria bacterium]
MWRLFSGIIKLAILAGLAILATNFLLKNQGTVKVDWLGYSLNPPIWLVLATLIVLVVVCVFAYNAYHLIMRAPGAMRTRRQRKRKESGHAALSLGLVALAAGDAEEAKRQASRADRLLKKPAITKLLAAQAAQLKGDEKAARRFFTEMLEDDETKFLGLRGLINQGIRDGREGEALLLAREAKNMRPDSKWVLDALFDLETRAGNMLEAQQVVREQKGLSYIKKDEAKHREAVLLISHAQSELKGQQAAAAAQSAGDAMKLAPDHTAGAIIKAEALLAAGKAEEAAKAIERAWKYAPQEELVGLYLQAKNPENDIARSKALRTLAKKNYGAALSNVLLAELLIAEEKFDEAKGYLDKAESQAPSERIYKLLARISQSTDGSQSEVRDYLMKAADAKGEGRWTCDACGNQQEEWSAVCGQCQEFGKIAWHEDDSRRSVESLIQPSIPLFPSMRTDQADAVVIEAEEAEDDHVIVVENEATKA